MKYFCKLILVAFIKSITQIIFIFWDRRINVIFVHLGEAREVLADGETDDPGLEHAADECRQRLVAAGLDERSAVQDDDAVGCRELEELDCAGWSRSMLPVRRPLGVQADRSLERADSPQRLRRRYDLYRHGRGQCQQLRILRRRFSRNRMLLNSI